MGDTGTRTQAQLEERLAKVAGDALARAMSDISEDHYCAGWNIGLEYDLWQMLRGGDRSYGMATVSPETVAELKQLADDAGGWHDGSGVVPMADWRKRFAHWFEHEHLPSMRRHCPYLRSQLGRTAKGLSDITPADVTRAEERLAKAEAELAAVLAEVPPAP